MSSNEYLEREISLAPRERVYRNNGNRALIDFLDPKSRRVLDVGCGAGDNAALVRSRVPECEVFGVTHSATEARIAQRYLTKCWVIDAEEEFPDDLANQSFDALIFSHVLEHLRNPEAVLARFSGLLSKGGQVLIAVPNILSYKMRVQFLRGDFRYQSTGILDDTHLRFFTYFTADQYLLSKAPGLKLTQKIGDGNLPLSLFRKHVFPSRWSRCIDEWCTHRWPNLFGHQILITASKQ